MVSFKVIIGILFGLLVAGIVSLGVLSYQKNQTSNATSYWVRHTHQALDQIEEVSALYKDIQLESNAFFISRDSTIIQPYTDARQIIFEEVNNIRTLTSDNPNQQRRIFELESLLKKLIAFTDSVLLIRKQEAFSEKGLLMRVKANRIFRKDIDDVTNNLRNAKPDVVIMDIDMSVSCFCV